MGLACTDVGCPTLLLLRHAEVRLASAHIAAPGLVLLEVAALLTPTLLRLILLASTLLTSALLRLTLLTSALLASALLASLVALPVFGLLTAALRLLTLRTSARCLPALSAELATSFPR